MAPNLPRSRDGVTRELRRQIAELEQMEENLHLVSSNFNTPLGRERADTLRARLQASKQELTSHLAMVSEAVEEPPARVLPAEEVHIVCQEDLRMEAVLPGEASQPIRRLVSNNAEERLIELDKTSGRRLGISIGCVSDTMLVVTDIHQGLVQEWNAANPGDMIEVGDRIMEVNGVHSDASLMATMCEQNVLLRCVMRRGSGDAMPPTGTAPHDRKPQNPAQAVIAPQEHAPAVPRLGSQAAAQPEDKARGHCLDVYRSLSQGLSPEIQPQVPALNVLGTVPGGMHVQCTAPETAQEEKEVEETESDARQLVSEAEHLMSALTSERVAEMPQGVRSRLMKDLDRLRLLLGDREPGGGAQQVEEQRRAAVSTDDVHQPIRAG